MARGPQTLDGDPMISEESSEEVEVVGYGRLIREWRCPFCHEPVRVIDWTFYIWCCEACGAFYAGGMELRYYDPRTEAEIEDLRLEHEYVEECDA